MTTYGICYGTTDATTIIECASLEAARTLAHETLSADIPSVDVVELEGAGPCYDSDGEMIAATHAPARTLATVTREHPAAALGRRGGAKATVAQKAAARANGRKGGRRPYPYVLVRTAYHGGGIISRHRTREAAEMAQRRYRSDCTCGCAVIVTREEYHALPSHMDAQSPYAPAR